VVSRPLPLSKVNYENPGNHSNKTKKPIKLKTEKCIYSQFSHVFDEFKALELTD
jgi:hypothetical protein